MDGWGVFQLLNWPLLLKAALQVAILVLITVFIYQRFIRRSHVEQLIKGLFITFLTFVGLWALARALNFPLLEVVFAVSIQLLMIGLIVIFQPELRRILLYLGQPELFGKPAQWMPKETPAEELINELTEAVKFLQKSKAGALIVLEPPNVAGGSYLEAGITLNARVSTELLLTIFHPRTPLHDGAVVINSENRMAAAGVLLPLTEDPKLSWQYGTRHRAAIGLTEVSDSYCLVVSEETGTISLAHQGTLEKVANVEELRKRLERLYQVKDPVARENGLSAFGERLLSGELFQRFLSKTKDVVGTGRSGPEP